MTSVELTSFGYGLLLGLLFTLWTVFAGWQRRRALNSEVGKLREHLRVHLEVTHEGAQQLKEELERLRLENENLRVTLKAWQQKPDRRELRALEVYDRAVRQLQSSAPGFAVHWEAALRDAEQSVAQIDSGVLAFARRLFVPAHRDKKDG